MRCAISDQACVPGRLKRGLCEKHYRRQRQRGTTSDPTKMPTLTRYEVVQHGEWACWEYQGPLYSNGYGKLSRQEHGTRLAHRASFIEHTGVDPGVLDLDHLCRNRKCMNPLHLEKVTRRVNLERGSLASGVCKNELHRKVSPGACRECIRAKNRRNGQRRTERLEKGK